MKLLDYYGMTSESAITLVFADFVRVLDGQATPADAKQAITLRTKESLMTASSSNKASTPTDVTTAVANPVTS